MISCSRSRDSCYFGRKWDCLFLAFWSSSFCFFRHFLKHYGDYGEEICFCWHLSRYLWISRISWVIKSDPYLQVKIEIFAPFIFWIFIFIGIFIRFFKINRKEAFYLLLLSKLISMSRLFHYLAIYYYYLFGLIVVIISHSWGNSSPCWYPSVLTAIIIPWLCL